MKKLLLSILSISSAFLLGGCYYDNLKELRPQSALPNSTSGCDTTNTVGYASHIAPIISSACLSCHNGSGAHDMSTYAAVSADAAGLLYSDVNTGAMPQGGQKLSDCDIAKIKKWIDTGLQP